MERVTDYDMKCKHRHVYAINGKLRLEEHRLAFVIIFYQSGCPPSLSRCLVFLYYASS